MASTSVLNKRGLENVERTCKCRERLIGALYSVTQWNWHIASTRPKLQGEKKKQNQDF